MSLIPVILMVTILSPFSSTQYLVYCPCMGRFGNQAEQFLGSLAFSKSINRTLVLPPWISYSSTSNKVNLIPWDSVFSLTKVGEYNDVITMEEFMTTLADSIWPEEDRISFCYTSRPGDESESCNAKHGSPFGPFWDSFGVNFITSKMYAPLNFNTNPVNIQRWKELFPIHKYPVLAMTGAPASFPVSEEHVSLQSFITWTQDWVDKADQWVKRNMGTGVEYLGLHLRNGGDWTRACEHVSSPGLTNLFSSAQCLGYRGQHGSLSMELCSPSSHILIQQITQIIRSTGLKYVYVASDHDHMLDKLRAKFSGDGVKFFKQEGDDFLLDLVILSRSNHFIGNCVSSFTAFIKRHRDINKLPSSFWAFNQSNQKTEL